MGMGGLFKELEIQLFRDGYPQYSYVVGESPELQNFRRFRTVRMRLAHLKQDKICQLEEELKQIDESEKSQLFLGNCRRDKNQLRKAVLENLDTALRDYDEYLQRACWTMNMPQPIEQFKSMQRNWLENTGSIARKERSYLDEDQPIGELLNIGDQKYVELPAIKRCFSVIVGLGYWAKNMLFPSKGPDGSKITVYRPLAQAIVRAVLAVITIILLLVPIIVLNEVQRAAWRFVTIFFAATIFVVSITVVSEARLVEIFAAGAAYAAVLVVFVSNNGIQQN